MNYYFPRSYPQNFKTLICSKRTKLDSKSKSLPHFSFPHEGTSKSKSVSLGVAAIIEKSARTFLVNNQSSHSLNFIPNPKFHIRIKNPHFSHPTFLLSSLQCVANELVMPNHYYTFLLRCKVCFDYSF